jgi:hypothetical protein
VRPTKQVIKDKTTFEPSELIPVNPPPVFFTNTVSIKISRGGFMDDNGVFIKAPKKSTQPFREVLKINGIWYWTSGVRNRKNELLVPNSLLFSKKKITK